MRARAEGLPRRPRRHLPSHLAALRRARPGACANGTYLLALRRFAKANVLILDDFGLERLAAAERRALLDILEDRYDVSPTVITSQLDPKNWHAVIDDATAADSICDHLVHNAHRIKLAGESIRKTRSSLTAEKKPTK